MSWWNPGEEVAQDALNTATRVAAQAGQAYANVVGTSAGVEAAKAAEAGLTETPGSIITALIPYAVIGLMGYWLYTVAMKKRR